MKKNNIKRNLGLITESVSMGQIVNHFNGTTGPGTTQFEFLVMIILRSGHWKGQYKNVLLPDEPSQRLYVYVMGGEERWHT